MCTRRFVPVHSILVAALLTTACGTTSDLDAKDGTYTPAQFSSAAEFQAIEVPDAQVCLTGTVSTTFSEAGQVFGYTVTVATGDTISIRTAGQTDLDTVVALYGPADSQGFYGRLPVAADDDSGVNGKAWIDTYAVKTGGTYFIALSTYGGTGLGTASLTVEINGTNGCAASGEVPCDADGNCPEGDACDATTGTCQPVALCADGTPGQPEVCDGIDNDCDGLTDEDVAPQACSLPNYWGTCAGTSVCVNGQFGECTGPVPAPEVCDGLDNDCDGLVDEGCSTTESCDADGNCPEGYACDATTGTCQPVTLCADGTPGQPEVCDGLDNDCDGLTDEDVAPQACSLPNYWGICAGTSVCVNGQFGECTGPVPAPEVCDGLDNDCDGLVDEGCTAGGPCSTDADCLDGETCDATTGVCRSAA